ncbi:hypothetical protein [Tsuneonella rigui]|uniref:hypothetical protein n=1 Tax=Tsuneonella rigui TaxID=1708790 RepID=UPI000F7F805B|nr:hypothetical protein [Tsuneonella rigui]
MSQVQPRQGATGLTSESWENEGGGLVAETLAGSLGVLRHLTETYSVGGFQYTNLTDAIAQARRMTKLEREVL